MSSGTMTPYSGCLSTMMPAPSLDTVMAPSSPSLTSMYVTGLSLFSQRLYWSQALTTTSSSNFKRHGLTRSVACSIRPSRKTQCVLSQVSVAPR